MLKYLRRLFDQRMKATSPEHLLPCKSLNEPSVVLHVVPPHELPVVTLDGGQVDEVLSRFLGIDSVLYEVWRKYSFTAFKHPKGKFKALRRNLAIPELLELYGSRVTYLFPKLTTLPKYLQEYNRFGVFLYTSSSDAVTSTVPITVLKHLFDIEIKNKLVFDLGDLDTVEYFYQGIELRPLAFVMTYVTRGSSPKKKQFVLDYQQVDPLSLTNPVMREVV